MKIANQYVSAAFNALGAEMTSLVKGNQEYLWQADAKYWGRQAPVLFPVVGKLKENQFTVEGSTYPMGQHGFARDMEFELISQYTDSIEFQLASNDETHKIYPFHFLLNIRYELIKNAVRTTYTVTNNNKGVLLFSIGAHPAFNCPMTGDEERSDYWLEFEYAESLETLLLDGGLFSGEKEKVNLSDNKLLLRKDLFDKDALVFEQMKSEHLSLHSAKGKWLTFKMEGFPYLGIWSKNQESPFICIEPWFGLADHQSHDQKLVNKEGIILLKARESFSCHYTVELH